MNALGLEINTIKIVNVPRESKPDVRILAIADINGKVCTVDYAGGIIGITGRVGKESEIPTLTKTEREQIKNTLSLYAHGVLLSKKVTTYFEEETSCEGTSCELE